MQTVRVVHVTDEDVWDVVLHDGDTAVWLSCQSLDAAMRLADTIHAVSDVCLLPVLSAPAADLEELGM